MEAQPLNAQNCSIHAGSVLRQIGADHLKALTNSRTPILESATAAASRRMEQSKETGAWLTAIPHILNINFLSAEEFGDNLCLRFGLPP